MTDSQNKVHVPILSNHDTQQIIGVVREEGRYLLVEFAPQVNIAEDQILPIFGQIGYTVVEEEIIGEVRIIRKLRIYEFSLGPFYQEAIQNVKKREMIDE